MKDIPREKLVFLDESGINIDMTRRYGRSIGSARVIDSVPCGTPKNVTILSSIRLDGQLAVIGYEGGTTKDQFLEYLEEDLLPQIRPGDYIVMDNMRSHHSKGVEELIRSKGAIPLYLPPYSPDLNPIEKMWSKMKAILRGKRIRDKDRLIPAAQEALASVSRSDCEGWFRCSGY